MTSTGCRTALDARWTGPAPSETAHQLDVDRGGSIQEGRSRSTRATRPGLRDATPVRGQIDVIVMIIDVRKPGHMFAAPARLEGIGTSGTPIGTSEEELPQGSDIPADVVRHDMLGAAWASACLTIHRSPLPVLPSRMVTWRASTSFRG